MLLPHPESAPPMPAMTMGSPAPSLGMPMQPNVTSGPSARGTIAGDTGERNRLLGSTPGVDQIANRIEGTGFGQAHPTVGRLLGDTAQVAGKIGDTALNVGGSLGIPAINTLARDIPGTTQHHEQLLGRANTALGQDIGNAQKEAQTTNELATAGKTNAETPEVAPEAEARIGLQNAQAGAVPSEIALHQAQTENLTHPAAKYEETPSGPMMIHSDGTAQHVTVDGKPIGAPVKLTYQTVDAADGPHVYGVDESGKKVVDLGKHYERPNTTNISNSEKNLWSVPQPDGSKKVVSLQPGMTIPRGAVSLSGQNAENKPTADEMRRSDLSENLNENFNQLEDIATRRPELFGPLAGRWAELKQKFGSDDPDLGALQTIEHQVGMAQVSAHGMRSAQGVAGAADSIINHLHSGVPALLGAIKAARTSVGTFQGDVQNKLNPSAENPGTTPKTGSTHNDPLGIR